MQTLSQLLPWVVWLAAALGVCGGDGVSPRERRLPPPAYRIAGVPLAEQQSDWCGPAALAAVLQYHGEKTTAAEIAQDIYLPGYRGTLNLDLHLWAKQRGFDVRAGPGASAEVRRAVARDLPVICMVRRRGRLADRNHFVIVRGYDDGRQVWLVDDGSGKETEMRAADLERDWRDCNRWMLVVKGRKPAPAAEGHDAPD